MRTWVHGEKNSLSKPSMFMETSDKSSEKFSEMLVGNEIDKSVDNPSYTDFFDKVKFEIYGEELISKEVMNNNNIGRVCLPIEWIGKHIKIIRID